MSNKKIAIIGGRGIPNKYGGFEKFTEYLSKALVKKGYSVWVSCENNGLENNIKNIMELNCFIFHLNHVHPQFPVMYMNLFMMDILYFGQPEE